MEEEKKLTEEANAPEVKKDDKLFKKPEGKSMYQKQRDDADDAETEAFAKGELSKYHIEKAETATVQEDKKHLKKLQAPMPKLLLQLNALKMQKIVFLKNVMTI